MADQPKAPQFVVRAERESLNGDRWGWAVRHRPEGYQLISWSGAGSQNRGEEVGSVQRFATISEAVQFDAELCTLRATDMTRFRVDAATIAPQEFALLLRGDSEQDPDPSAWPSDVTRWVAGDDLLDDSMELVDFDWTHRWVRINGARVSTFAVESKSGRQWIPIIVGRVADEDRPEDDIWWDPEASDFAYYLWSSGGSFPSSDGGSRILELTGDVLIEYGVGDSRGAELREAPRTPTEVARMLYDWIVDNWIQVPAALEREPFDLTDSLTPDDKQRWDDALSRAEVWTSIPSDAAIDPELERLLAADALYQATVGALAHPTSPLGCRFLEALEEAGGSSGTIGYLVVGSWVESDE